MRAEGEVGRSSGMGRNGGRVRDCFVWKETTGMLTADGKGPPATQAESTGNRSTTQTSNPMDHRQGKKEIANPLFTSSKICIPISAESRGPRGS